MISISYKPILRFSANAHISYLYLSMNSRLMALVLNNERPNMAIGGIPPRQKLTLMAA